MDQRPCSDLPGGTNHRTLEGLFGYLAKCTNIPTSNALAICYGVVFAVRECHRDDAPFCVWSCL